MNFNKHLSLEGKHAFLGASSYHWLNYSDEKLDETYLKWMAKQRGTELHAFAAEAIRLGIRLPKTGTTLNMYVNDAIGFKLTPEQVLYYSDNCFGTADTIGFKNDFLRVHDLKTGEIPTKMSQLRVYDALFCLEYGIDPKNIRIENRIYQYDKKAIENPDPEDILRVMDTIVRFDMRIEKLKLGE